MSSTACSFFSIDLGYFYIFSLTILYYFDIVKWFLIPVKFKYLLWNKEKLLNAKIIKYIHYEIINKRRFLLLLQHIVIRLVFFEIFRIIIYFNIERDLYANKLFLFWISLIIKKCLCNKKKIMPICFTINPQYWMHKLDDVWIWIKFIIELIFFDK